MGVFLQERFAFYAELVDMNGQVFLDESKKIEPKDYQDDAEMLQSPSYVRMIPSSRKNQPIKRWRKAKQDIGAKKNWDRSLGD
ncbi:hypothetical protein RJP21_08540 [Paenibacillus sp. VCA1]|uniref:hypothetical protein n=1 Tax=Paenibacillus sp. VCA1 TaxID=3039148 RepID=UPI002870D77E|nr:hypothetical protein [Paenibacillus sp. VCA1]MDR9853646.1 hypothetical protein [Paenibacillus sp. VCA1]